MRIMLPLTVALLVAGAPTASAQSGLNLFWDHCGADGGTTTMLFDCSTNAGAEVLIASVVIPADMPQFGATTAVFRVHVADSPSPPWWQVAAGQCRANAMWASFDPTLFPASENCPSIWDDTVPLQVQAVQVGLGSWESFRVYSVAALPAGSEIPLLADGTERVVCRLLVQHANTVGTAACEGCRTGACILLDEMHLQQPAGMASYRLASPNWNSFVGYNADAQYGAPAIYCTTPALNRTWGAIKTLYR